MNPNNPSSACRALPSDTMRRLTGISDTEQLSRLRGELADYAEGTPFTNLGQAWASFLRENKDESLDRARLMLSLGDRFLAGQLKAGNF